MSPYTFWANIYNNAKAMFYNDSSSNLGVNNVQDAIDKIVATAGGKPFATTLVDPALNAITQSMVDDKSGVVITLTGAGNNQTLPTPTDTTPGNTRFVIVNNDSSTDPINIIGGTTSVLDPGKKVKAIWEGTTYAFSEAEGILLDNGTDIYFQNSTRNFDIQTGKFKAGSNTEISESSGDTLIENTSATDNIFIKLGDALGATFAQIKDSANNNLLKILSSATAIFGKTGSAGLIEVLDASGDVQERISAVSANISKNTFYFNATIEVANGGTINLPDATSGFFKVKVVGTSEIVYTCNVNADGTFSIPLSDGVVPKTDTGNTLALYKSGTQVIAKNNYGVAKDFIFEYEYKSN